MRILGVDPSYNRSGWAVLEDGDDQSRLLANGVVAPPDGERWSRLLHIFTQFDSVIATWSPDAVLLERPGFWQRKGGSRRETIEVLAMSRCCILLAASTRSIPANEVDLHVLRRAAFGRVNAERGQVVQFVESRGFYVPLRPRGRADDDIANAILVALYGLEVLERVPTVDKLEPSF